MVEYGLSAVGPVEVEQAQSDDHRTRHRHPIPLPHTTIRSSPRHIKTPHWVGLPKDLHTRYISAIARRTLSDPDTRLKQLTLYEARERPLWIRDAAGTVR